MFFPIGDCGPALLQITAAKAVCARCPVATQCLSFALVFLPEGLAGGLTAEERAELRHRRRAPRPPVPVDQVDGVDRLVVESLVAGLRVSGASPRELAHAAVELRRTGGRGVRWIAGWLGVGERRVHRWLQRHRAGEPLTASGRVGRVSA